MGDKLYFIILVVYTQVNTIILKVDGLLVNPSVYLPF